MFEKIRHYTTSIYNTITGTPSETTTHVQHAQEGSIAKAKTTTTTTTTTTVPLSQRSTTITSTTPPALPPDLPPDILFEIFKHLPPEQKLLQLREVNQAFRNTIDIHANFLGDISVKLNLSDISDILSGNSNEKLEFAKKLNLNFSLDVESILQDSHPHRLEMLRDFLTFPQAASISHISFGTINKTNIEEIIEILELIKSNEDNLTSLTSLSINELKTFLPLPELPSIKSLFCGIVAKNFNTENLTNLTNLKIDTLMPVDFDFAQSIETLTIGTLHAVELIFENLPNLRMLTINSTTNQIGNKKNRINGLSLKGGLNSLEVIDIFHNPADSASFYIYKHLPNLKALHIHSYPKLGYVYFESKNLPELEEFTCPPEVKEDEEIQIILQDIEKRKSLE